jgi:predicted amidohydrolase YtcJ
VEMVRQAGARVVTQPAFVLAHGDRYMDTVAGPDRPWLYRLRAWLNAGVSLAAGSDSPYGPLDPWLAMTSAIQRRSAGGLALDAAEGLTPEQAWALYSPAAPQVGDLADLCLLRTGWREARAALAAELVAATYVAGRPIWAASR